jgi:hypothetical protein
MAVTKPANAIGGGRKSGAKTGLVSRAENEFCRHLKALDLADADAYRAWCREHGFRSDLKKDWDERRKEVRAHEKARAEANTNADVARHIAVLGLPGAAEYVAWCREHGFGTATHKSRQQRREEQTVAERERAQQALRGARRLSRRPDDVLRALHRNDLDAADLKTPSLLAIHGVFASLGEDAMARDALLRLLLHVQRHGTAALLGIDPVVDWLGPQPGNTFVAALLALSRHHADWLRPIEEWRPDTHNALRQFGSLARHLLARYDVPAFLDSAWFRGDSASNAMTHAQQDWFKHVGIGQNIRTAPDLPVHLTKRAAHLFLQAPGNLSIEAALRWSQVRALGGDEPLARAIIATRLGESLQDDEFWGTVLHFFVNNPLLDTVYVGPIIDYIYHRKYVGGDEIIERDGNVRVVPPDANFSMKGRTADALRRLVDEWHRDLAREAKRPVRTWEPSGFGPFRHVERSPDEKKEAGGAIWTIHEILNTRELTDEGREMRHCVASYARSCARGTTSIWSLQVKSAPARRSPRHDHCSRQRAPPRHPSPRPLQSAARRQAGQRPPRLRPRPAPPLGRPGGPHRRQPRLIFRPDMRRYNQA